MDPIAQELVEEARGGERVAREFVAWIERNEPQVREKKAGLIKAFRRHASTLARLSASASRPSCVGVFGPSQNGKSHLIATLARKKGSPALNVKLGGETYDFIQQINPLGKSESTGLVTRFSLRPFRNAQTHGPVPLRLLTQTDIIKIIGNFYYSDVLSKSEAPSADEISKLFEEVTSGAPPKGSDLSSDDVYELQDYFERYFSHHQRIHELRKNFWDRVAELAPRLAIGPRARLLGVLWNHEPAFTALYERLYRVLESLGFPENAFAGIDSLIPRETSIITVDTLYGLGRDGGDKIQVTGESGITAMISRCDIAAVVAELHLEMTEKSHDFLDHADLLDFPGARSRLDLKDDDLRKHLAQPDGLALLYRRGKVAYLFERYRDELELTSMLLCINDELPNVQSLPEAVNAWVGATHGKTPEERSLVRTSLFFILTFFDRTFQVNAGDRDPVARWTTRLKTSLTDNFGGTLYEWPMKWDAKGPFRNCFWFRNTTIKAKDIFEYNGNEEIGILARERPFIDEMRRGFLSAAAANCHFEEPSAAFDAGLQANDGGASYLAGKLTPICDVALKHEQVRARLGDIRADMVKQIVAFYVSGNPEREMERRMVAAKNAARYLMSCADAQHFDVIVHIGDLPDSMALLRPLAVTATVGYAIPGTSTESKVLEWGGALEYSLLYLQNNVRDQGFGNFVSHLTPVVEFSLETPTDAGGGGTTGTINPGLIWSGQYTQLGIEATIPVNHASGDNVGVLMQLHFYVDDIFPHSLGTPLFGGNR